MKDEEILKELEMIIATSDLTKQRCERLKGKLSKPTINRTRLDDKAKVELRANRMKTINKNRNV